MKGKIENILVLKNGKYVREIKGIKATAKKYNLPVATVSNCIKNGKETVKGYSFDIAIGAK